MNFGLHHNPSGALWDNTDFEVELAWPVLPLTGLSNLHFFTESFSPQMLFAIYLQALSIQKQNKTKQTTKKQKQKIQKDNGNSEKG